MRQVFQKRETAPPPGGAPLADPRLLPIKAMRSLVQIQGDSRCSQDVRDAAARIRKALELDGRPSLDDSLLALLHLLTASDQGPRPEVAAPATAPVRAATAPVRAEAKTQEPHPARTREEPTARRPLAARTTTGFGGHVREVKKAQAKDPSGTVHIMRVEHTTTRISGKIKTLPSGQRIIEEDEP